MTSYYDRGVKPKIGNFLGFDHVQFYVGNALQSAFFYCTQFGFEPYAFRGIETGSRDLVSYVVRRNDIQLVFTSSTHGDVEEIDSYVKEHGDSVKEIVFLVDDCKAVFDRAVKHGAKVVKEVQTLKEDGFRGKVLYGKVEAPWGGGAWNSFIERKGFEGVFLPGFVKLDNDLQDPMADIIEPPNLGIIDHLVPNVPEGDMEKVAKWYIEKLGFHKFWTVDESQMCTENTSLRSIVVADWDEHFKMPINEPAPGKMRSQVQEFVEYFGGAGIQHLALSSSDIIADVAKLRRRGVAFLNSPKVYYTKLRSRLSSKNAPKIIEDIDKLEELKILVDYDEKGYLLQIFSKPVQDRPTFFLEIIQRHGHSGFGLGNFKSLFEALEREQEMRGNLV